MAGENVNPGKGFHNIALPIAITANTLGKKEDEVIAACSGLLEKHQSDGNRYNTPVKRRNEILRQRNASSETLRLGSSVVKMMEKLMERRGVVE